VVDANDELSKYIAKEGDDVGFETIAPSEEQMAKVREIQA
jgi:hypothetical protein